MTPERTKLPRGWTFTLPTEVPETLEQYLKCCSTSFFYTPKERQVLLHQERLAAWKERCLLGDEEFYKKHVRKKGTLIK